MELKKYATIIEQTAVYPKSVDNFDLAYCYLGLMGELYEYTNAENDEDAHKEAGDVIWYLTAIANFYKLDIEQVFVTKKYSEYEEDHDYDLFMSFPEKIKKYYRDGTEISLEVIKEYLTLVWNQLVSDISEEKIGDILQINYDKLLKRKEAGTLKGSGDNR